LLSSADLRAPRLAAVSARSTRFRLSYRYRNREAVRVGGEIVAERYRRNET
jgi:hypothetical protein